MSVTVNTFITFGSHKNIKNSVKHSLTYLFVDFWRVSLPKSPLSSVVISNTITRTNSTPKFCYQTKFCYGSRWPSDQFGTTPNWTSLFKGKRISKFIKSLFSKYKVYTLFYINFCKVSATEISIDSKLSKHFLLRVMI